MSRETACLACMAIACASLLSMWALMLWPCERGECHPNARMLGRVVEVDKFGCGRWERCVVVAVSWKGGVKVRRLSEMDGYAHGNGFWVQKGLVDVRVREAGD